MIDLDDLERNLSWYESRIKNPEPGVIYHLDYNEREALSELLGRLREAEADAKRYRWLRDEACHNEWHTVGSADPSVWDVIVDEYIEEAMNHEASGASDRVES